MKIVTAVTGVLGVTLVVVGSGFGDQQWSFASANTREGTSTATPSTSASPELGMIADLSPALDVSLSTDAVSRIVQQACVICHNDAALTGGLTLQGFDASKPDPEIGEKMVRKLRAGMMPPPVAPYRPAPDTIQAMAATIETVLDKIASRDPNPGSRPAQRLNRAEYERAIRELLALEVNAGTWLVEDTKSANFDNIADAQILSPLVIESYLNAASEVSRYAVGDRNAAPLKQTYVNSDYISQHPWDHVEGAPYGTRGGVVVDQVFPADGYYTFEMMFTVQGNFSRLEDIDLSINGERVALLHYERNLIVGTSADGRDAGGGLSTEPIFVRAGQHRVSAAVRGRVKSVPSTSLSDLVDTLVRRSSAACWKVVHQDARARRVRREPHRSRPFDRGRRRRRHRG
jgi:hypothetical protein